MTQWELLWNNNRSGYDILLSRILTCDPPDLSTCDEGKAAVFALHAKQ